MTHGERFEKDMAVKSFRSIIMLGIIASSVSAVPLPDVVKQLKKIAHATPTLSSERPSNQRSALGGFDFENVILHAWLDLSDFGNPSNGNDCWGYTSPSGREYALMGLSNKMTVVEITDPSNPVIIDSISHSNSLWAGAKNDNWWCQCCSQHCCR